jgi:DNA-binding response OmpR family regulator
MRLLVVEDEHKLARVIKKALESDGYAIDVEYDSSAGFAMASTEPYDALLVDRMLPGDYKDGVEMVKSLRANKTYTPALILTALGDVSHKTEGLDAGADDYLVKPFAIDELLARVRALLRRPPHQMPTILTCGKLSFDTATRTATFSEQPISLTTKERGLLEYLLSASGRAVSKEQIIAHVWDFDADVLPNTVEVYIRSLRKKIDARFNVRYIKTVHGVGYKMEA